MGKIKLMIVDDEVDLLAELKPLMERSGYDVVSAANGAQALEVISREKPDLIVLDMLMPRLDGRDVLRRLRQAGNWTPVILLTDTLGPMVGDKADVVLAARRGPVSAFHSLTVPMTIVNALLLALSSVDQEKVMTNLDKLDQLRERLKKTNGSLS